MFGTDKHLVSPWYMYVSVESTAIYGNNSVLKSMSWSGLLTSRKSSSS